MVEWRIDFDISLIFPKTKFVQGVSGHFSAEHFRTWRIYLSANKHKIVGKQCNYIKVFGLEKNLFPKFEIVFIHIPKVFIKSVFHRGMSWNF